VAEMVACRAQEVISVSATDLQALQRRRLLRTGTGHHIPNAINSIDFAPASRAAARRAAGIPLDGLLIGTVARLVPQKGVGVLIDAVRDVPDANAVIIGDGPLRATLERQAADLGGRVRFMGMRDDVAALLPALDIFVLPSQWEGEPIALLQAMACGLPCVATATDGSNELLRGGRGLITKIDDPKDLAAAIRTLADSPDRRQALGEAARQVAEQRSWRSTAERVLRIYNTLIGVQPTESGGTRGPS
jgi:glycosyltransferase involved in cell wall biosynthesis